MKSTAVVLTNDPDVQSTLKDFFGKHGYNIQFKESGSGVMLEIIRRSSDLFILDVDGKDDTIRSILRVIRKMNLNVPIIALSEDTTVMRIRDLSQEGIFYCAVKPIQTAELDRVMEAHQRLQQKRENQGQVLSWAVRPIHRTV